MDIEAEWRQAIEDTEVPPLSDIWIGILVGGLIAAIIVGGGIYLFEGSFIWAVTGGIGAAGGGCICVMLERNQRRKRRQSIVEMLMVKIRNGKETTELVATLSALGDLGLSARVALPLIEEIQVANVTCSLIYDACMSARFQITGTEQGGGGNSAALRASP